MNNRPTKKAKSSETMASEESGYACFTKDGFCGPVTALCWVSGAEVLLTGRGTDVLASRVAGSQQQHLGALRIFESGRVHGIKGRVTAGSGAGGINQRVVIAAHSEKNITVAEFAVPDKVAASLQCARVRAKLWELDDWVVDVQLLRGPGQALEDLRTVVDKAADARTPGSAEEWGWLAAGLAHNTVEIWDWQRQTRVHCVHCLERPVLFTMAMHGEDGDGLVVAAGGFIREVLCWQVLGPKSGQPVQRLKGHTGVVHCVRWRSDGRALVSGSEDRSVRVWLAPNESGAAAHVAGSSVPILLHAATLWGHAARIWECQITDSTIVTVSEDTSGRVYTYNQAAMYARLPPATPLLDSRAHAQLVQELTDGRSQQAAVSVEPAAAHCVSVLKGHQGKHVWKCVICPLAAGGEVVATGGNDAATKIWAATACVSDGAHGRPGGMQLAGGDGEGGGGDGGGGGGGVLSFP